MFINDVNDNIQAPEDKLTEPLTSIKFCVKSIIIRNLKSKYRKPSLIYCFKVKSYKWNLTSKDLKSIYITSSRRASVTMKHSGLQHFGTFVAFSSNLFLFQSLSFHLIYKHSNTQTNSIFSWFTNSNAAFSAASFNSNSCASLI